MTNPGKPPLLVCDQTCDEFVARVSSRLGSAGYQTVTCFNVLVPVPSAEKCTCSQTNLSRQMVVLLVYLQDTAPVGLTIFGDGLQTSVYIHMDASFTEMNPNYTKIAGLLAAAQ